MRLVTTIRRTTRTRRLLALALGAIAFPADAATTVWRTELARGGDEQVLHLFPVLEGNDPQGFWLPGTQSWAEVNWVARHANDGSRIGLQRFHGPIGTGRSDSRGDLVMRNEPPNPSTSVFVDDCFVERGALGAPRSVATVDPAAPGGGDGVIESDSLGIYGRSAALFRTLRDCRATPMPAIGSGAVAGVRNIPDDAAAYVLAGEIGARPDELVRVDHERVQWRLPLGTIASPASHVGLGDADAAGVGLVWFRTDGAAARTNLAWVTADGRVAWRRELDAANARIVAWRPAPLVARFAQQTATSLEALDRETGATRFVTPLPLSLRSLESLPAAGAGAGWRVAASGDASAAAVLDVDASGDVRVRWRASAPGSRAYAELADGSLLIGRTDDAFRTHWSLAGPGVTVGAGRALPEAGRVPLARTPAFLAQGPDGTVLAGYRETDRIRIVRATPDGRIAWDATLAEGRFGGARVIAVAVHATRACVVTDSDGAGRLRCYDARTGAIAFDVRVEGSSARWRLGAFGDAIHLVDARISPGPFVPIEDPRLRIFAPSGEERFSRDLPLETRTDTLSAFGASGEIVATRTGLAGSTMRAIAPDGTLRWRIVRPRGTGLVARVADGGGALLVESTFDGSIGRTTATRVDGAGRERWRRDVTGAAVVALGSDWLVRGDSTVRRFADADGSDRWIVASAPTEFLLAVARDGSGFVHGDGWYDGASGARIGSLVTPANRVANPILRFDGTGGLLRLSSRLDERDSVLTLERLSRDADVGPRARAAAAGVWHAPSVPGQGIALAVDERTGDVEGRWLTFAPPPASRPVPRVRIDAQRWYRLSGRAAFDGDSVALRIDAPQPTGFDGGAVSWRSVGTARWRMRDCARVELDYDIADGELSRRGLLVLERPDGQPDCESRRGGEFRADVAAWSTDGDPGRSLLVAQRRDGHLLAYWPTFVPAGADAGRPHWLTLYGAGSALRIERTLGGSFVERATRNTMPVGDATLHRQGCSRLAIDFRFDADELAAPFDGRSVRLVLRRQGACPQ